MFDSSAILGVFFVLGLLFLLTNVLVVVIWQKNATRRAQMSVEREEAYRRLSEQAVEAMQNTSAVEKKLAEGVDELRTRIAAIEKILREVE